MKKFRWLLLLTIAVSCNKEKEFDYPLIFIGEVTNIDTTGVVFHANIKDESKEGITDYGFVWSISGVPDINSSQVKIVKPISLGVLNVKITNDLIPDTNYIVRAFARNSRYITYSNSVSFRSKGSLPPVINDFYPKKGTSGTTVTIYGENFSGSVNNNIVHFGKVIAKVDSASCNKLIVKIDETSNISGEVNISIEVANRSIKSKDKFRLDGINIVGFTPTKLIAGDVLTIKIENYDINPLNNVIKIGGKTAEIINLNHDSISCFVPYNVLTGNNQISITSNNKTTYSTTLLIVQNPWNLIKTNQSYFRYGATSFSINRDIYYGLGRVDSSGYYSTSNNLYKFNLNTNSWMKVASLPDKGREGSIAFSINGKGYVCLGYQATGEYFNDLYEYDPESDRWTKKSNFPGNTKYYSLCLVIDNKAYIGLGLDVNISLSQFWEYDPACDSWTQKASFGGGTRMGATGFSIGNKGYVGGGTLSWENDPLNDFWEYDTTTDTWKRIADFPGVNRAWASGFTINNKGYVGAGSWVNNYYNDFWRYDPIDNKWIRIADITYERRVSKFFIIDNIGYSYSGGVSVNDNFIIFNPNF